MKRTLDVLVSALGLVLAAPLMLFGAALVAISMGWPILFAQRRPGLREKSFTIRKFRTMKLAASNAAQGNGDADRLTGVGRFLRATSLDELPQLWNVLRGDMSLVGPRPLLEQYLPRYTPEQRRRHLVRPGITGWAQVNGRNALSWSDKFEHDVWYVDHQSTLLDLKILALTITKVVLQRDTKQKGQVTCEEFQGIKHAHE